MVIHEESVSKSSSSASASATPKRELHVSMTAESSRRSSGGSNISDDRSMREEHAEVMVDGSSSINTNNNKPSSSSSFQSSYPHEFLLRIPKSDLHIHLDGSIRLSTLIELAQEQNIPLPSYNENELRQIVFPQTYSSLQEYLYAFGYILSVLRNKEALERVSYEVGMDAYNVGVRYLEVRFAPQLHAIPGVLSIEEVICAVNRGLGRAVIEADELDRLSDTTNEDKKKVEKMIRRLSGRATSSHPYHPDAPPHHYGIIVCAMRYFLPSFSPYYEAFCEVHKGEDLHRIFGLASVALVTAVIALKGRRNCHFGDNDHDEDTADEGDATNRKHEEAEEESSDDFILPIVAIDIAGAESGYPASDHREAFDLAHSSFLYKTVHAGEAYGPESIFSAITDLHAERIGHGCNIFRWDLIGTGEGRGGRSKSNKEKEEMSDDQKRAYVENLTRYLGVSSLFLHCLLSLSLYFSY